MARLKVEVKIIDLDVFTELINYLKSVVLDKRMPGELANEMQENIGRIMEECRKL